MTDTTNLRSPICSVLGHVDHGKSSILDKIRGSAIIAQEAGGITQAIGASIIPMDTIKKVCGNLLDNLKTQLTIPGLLFIDTPGHAAFTSLRKRGGSLADIAIVVVDINEGFKPQTIEAIEILITHKTPFIIAANKVDLIPGWKSSDKNILPNLSSQSQEVQQKIDTKLYEVVGQIYEKFQLNAERFDRVDDYTKNIAIIPCSAKTGEGLPELIMVMTGLAQKYLEQNLQLSADGQAKGTVLEVKEEKGLGTTMDVIIFDGTMNVGDTIIIGTMNEPIVTRVKALFEPAALAEMRDKKSKFKPVKSVTAAIGVKVSAPEIDNVISGMPVRVAGKDNLEEIKEQIKTEIEEVMVDTDEDGIIIKADNLGSLEALMLLLREKDIPIRKASIGDISKKDVMDAETNLEKDELQAVILGFSVKVSEEIIKNAGKVKILTNDVIYKLIEQFEEWKLAEEKKGEQRELEFIVRPAKLQILEGYVFRQNNPAIVGCDILVGKIKTGTPLMKKNKEITRVKSIQADKDNLTEVSQGKQVAVGMEGVTVGRQINEGDTLYTAIPEADFKKLKQLKKYLSEQEIEVIKEIARLMREDNPVWGV
ncbi:translation initiation factor IF-2 [Nanoarchaeota archaeon]